MNCKKCGFLLAENDQFCKNCGETVNSPINNMGAQSSVEQNNVGAFPQPNTVSAQPINNAQSSFVMNNNQPGTQNGNIPVYNNQSTNKQSNSGKYIAIGLVAVVIIAAVVLTVSMLMNKKVGNDGNDVKDKGGSTTTTAASSYKVTFDDFVFEIPDNLIYQESDGQLAIGDEEGTWSAAILTLEGSFTTLLANKNQIQSNMINNGYTASAAVEKTLGGLKFITLEVLASGESTLVAYTKLNAMNIAIITMVNANNDFDYKLLEDLAPIIKSASYVGGTQHNISSGIKIDTSFTSELAK